MTVLISSSSAPVRGIVYMILGGVFMAVNNAMLKWVSGYPPGEVLFLRGIFTALSILVLVSFSGGLRSLRVNRISGHLVRAGCMVFSTFCFVLGLRYLPLGETTAITFAGPLFVTAMAGPFLGESVGWRRWMAVVVGFSGILLITRPTGDAFQLAALLPLGAAFGAAIRDVVTRKISVNESSIAILLTTTLALMWGGLMTLPFGWRMPTPFDMGVIAASGVLVTAGHYYTIETFRHAETALVSPFKYLSIVWAILIGFMVWGDIPDVWMIGGTSLVVLSGLYILHREIVAQRSRTARDPV
jgi:drug/metabolite transporter (DMT)-like permease